MWKSGYCISSMLRICLAQSKEVFGWSLVGRKIFRLHNQLSKAFIFFCIDKFGVFTTVLLFMLTIAGKNLPGNLLF